MDRQRALGVLVKHRSQRDWLWLGLRRRCRQCGQRFPCPPRRVALAHLADRHGHLGAS